MFLMLQNIPIMEIDIDDDNSSENESLTKEDEKIDIDDIMKKHESSEENFKTQKWIKKKNINFFNL